MSFIPMLLTILKLFFIVGIGFFCQRCGVFPPGTQAALTRIVLYIATPCSILYSVFANEQLPSPQQIPLLLGAALGSYLLLFLTSLPLVRLLRVSPGQRSVYILLLMFSNYLFIGMPVIQSVFGDQALFYLAVFSMPFSPAFYGVGAGLLLKERQQVTAAQGCRQAFRFSQLISPALVASILAIILAFTSVSLPSVITGTIYTLSCMTTPGALLVVGISVADMSLKTIFRQPKIYLVCVFRLILFPLLIWAILRLLISDQLALGVCVISSAMPAAASLPMLTTDYGMDSTAAVQGIFLTTLFSLVTIPLMTTLLF